MINRILRITITLMGFTSYAASGYAQSEDVMIKLQKMQQCMSTIDMTKVEALEQKANSLRADVNKLCASGELEQAQQKAMAFGEEVAASDIVKQVANCAEIMKGMIPELSLADFEKDFSNINICDASI